MLKKVTLVTSCIVFASLAQTVVANAHNPLNPGVTMNELSQRMPVHWVSIEQIKQSLANVKPINVGFDVDDTLLFSSPGFFRGKQEFSPKSNEYLRNPKFWHKINNDWDYFSIPKKSGYALIQMHLKRGDHIYFITGRPQTKTEKLTSILQHDFAIPEDKMNPVIFSGPKHGAKTPYIKAHKITLYYGDSDGDISDARAAGAKAIRVLRPLNSTNKPMPHNGKFGEEVLVNSRY